VKALGTLTAGLCLFAFLFQARLPAVVPAPDITLNFNHAYHVLEEELECDTCHGGAETSSAGQDNLLPSMEVCGDCHDIEDEDECATCHMDPDDPEEVPRIQDYSQKFSHERHVTAGLECQDCHEAVALKEEVGEYLLPGMLECQDCHDRKNASLECESCHMPEDELRPPSHTPDFVHAHSDLARNNAHETFSSFTCQTCHDDNFCQDCHQGDNLDRLTHPLNYDVTHALDARGNERACVSCHVETTFCADCHVDNNIMPQNHGPGWAVWEVGGRHVDEARQDLASCISCHEDNAEVLCITCHADP